VLTRLTPELITICIEGGTPGDIYILETCTNLPADGSPGDWTDLQTFWQLDSPLCETTHATVSSTRYYRVRRAQ
jgi:hypothetical protein